MRWNRPDFEEINLSGEVTAYVNSDEEVRKSEQPPERAETAGAAQQMCVAGAAAQRSPGG
jgi:coenzyme PQQ precursor peptide PqqA